MKTKQTLKKLSTSLLAASIISAPTVLHAAPGTVATQPLFTQNAVDPNVMLVIDDSSSMDFEVLFTTNDGALYWDDDNDTFHALGDGVTTSDDKYVYLFPNGSGFSDGKRQNSIDDHFAIPPFIQYAYTRSPAYNKAYFDPAVTYTPWTDYNDQAFGDIDETNAPADPFHDRDNDFFDLTDSTLSMNGSGEQFRVQDDMIIPKDTVYNDSGTWETASADTDLGEEGNGQR
jgi:type IV pilus assembly protein PilY1